MRSEVTVAIRPLRQKKNVTKKALDLSLADSRLYVGFRLYSLSPAWLLDAADTPYRIGALKETVEALPHMFGDGFDMLVQEGLETLCTDTFGDRIQSLQAIDERAIAKTVKTLSLPEGSSFIVLSPVYNLHFRQPCTSKNCSYDFELTSVH